MPRRAPEWRRRSNDTWTSATTIKQKPQKQLAIRSRKVQKFQFRTKSTQFLTARNIVTATEFSIRSIPLLEFRDSHKFPPKSQARYVALLKKNKHGHYIKECVYIWRLRFSQRLYRRNYDDRATFSSSMEPFEAERLLLSLALWRETRHANSQYKRALITCLYVLDFPLSFFLIVTIISLCRKKYPCSIITTLDYQNNEHNFLPTCIMNNSTKNNNKHYDNNNYCYYYKKTCQVC